MDTISCKSAATVPVECHRIGAKSAKDSRFLESSNKTTSHSEAEDNAQVANQTGEVSESFIPVEWIESSSNDQQKTTD